MICDLFRDEKAVPPRRAIPGRWWAFLLGNVAGELLRAFAWLRSGIPRSETAAVYTASSRPPAARVLTCTHGAELSLYPANKRRSGRSTTSSRLAT